MSHELLKLSILAVDDERHVLEALSVALEARGYAVRTASSGEAALEAIAADRPDVVLLDLAMPGLDGVETCRRIRTWSSVQILVLSARTDEPQKIEALDAGADDYVTKPFSLEELLARIRSALRRAQLYRDEGSIREHAGIRIDLAARLVTVDGEEVHLTPTEYELLRVFMLNTGRVLTHSFLLRSAMGPGYEDALDNLRTFMMQLRRKIERDPNRPRRIVTEPGVGYRFIAAEKVSRPRVDV